MRDPVDPFRIREARRWLFDKALPLWSDAGIDRDNGGAVEVLGFDGRDGASDFKRTRVQARQAYAFTHGRLLGWRDEACAADHCWRYLHAHCRRCDGAYVRLTRRDGGVLDAAADAYDMAFVLFALAWRLRAGDDSALGEAHDLMDVYDRLLALGPGLGWRAAEDRPDGRLQNPHMHLLEAALDLAEAGRDQRFADVACQVLTLFRERMFDPSRGVLIESYSPDWTAPPPARQRVEPGHLYEWVWLLGRAKAVLGEDLMDEARALHAFAAGPGTDAATGLVHDALDGEALVPAGTFRIWPQTEALKAHLAMAEHGGAGPGDIDRLMDLLFDHYLAAAPSGGWIDQFGEGWSVRSPDVPASILYHLTQAFSELLRLESALAPSAAPAKEAPRTGSAA